MLVVFVHGWSVTNTNTYGGLPEALATKAPASLDVTVQHLYLAKYVSFADEVTVDDIARGMRNAVNAQITPQLASGERFACVTHSTGGPVVRQWIDLYYRNKLDKCPLQHLVMLAPANHGSALAQLGKSRLARMKFFAEGVQPGTGVLNWLELGSDSSWDLNVSWLDYDAVASGLYPFVLTGQSIDRKFYDNLNSYTGEAGSDGVVRVAAANMNYGLIRLIQQNNGFALSKEGRSPKTALGVLPGRSHSGTDMGVMASVPADDDGSHPTLRWLLRCLGVNSPTGYNALVSELNDLTDKTQADEKTTRKKEVFLLQRTFTVNRYCMFVFRLHDDRGNTLIDYDVIFTAGPDYDENHLAPGFFKDRQRNQRNPGKLTYYIDYDVMAEWLAKPELEGKFGFKIIARPDSGFASYWRAEYRGTFGALKRYFEPNQTLMVDVQLNRHVVEGVFKLTQDLTPEYFGNQDKGEEIS
jgi:hypothetical protein